MNGGKSHGARQRDPRITVLGSVTRVSKKYVNYKVYITEINEITCKFRSCNPAYGSE